MSAGRVLSTGLALGRTSGRPPDPPRPLIVPGPTRDVARERLSPSQARYLLGPGEPLGCRDQGKAAVAGDLARHGGYFPRLGLRLGLDELRPIHALRQQRP